MYDIAPGHSAQDTRLELTRLGVKRLSWPPASPVLNPIETNWQIMEHNLLQDNLLITTNSRLQEAIQQQRGAIDWVTILQLLETMPVRIEAVVDAVGGHSKR